MKKPVRRTLYSKARQKPPAEAPTGVGNITQTPDQETRMALRRMQMSPPPQPVPVIQEQVDEFEPRPPANALPPRLDLRRVRNEEDPDLEIEPSEEEMTTDMTASAEDLGLDSFMNSLGEMPPLDKSLSMIDHGFDEIAVALEHLVNPGIRGLKDVSAPAPMRIMATKMESFLNTVLLPHFNRMCEMLEEAQSAEG